MNYVFIDPFNSSNSGVSTYINSASTFIKSSIIKRKEDESIEDFRLRIQEVSETISSETVFEAPETLSSLLYVKNPLVKKHIRLHLARTIGKKIQNQEFDIQEFKDEKETILSADFLSAPSGLILQLTNEHFKINRKASIYPNPYKRIFQAKVFTKKYDFVFIGRWQNLKGIKVIEDLGKKGYKICVLSPDYKHINLKNIDAFEGSESNKDIYIPQAKMMLLPSLVESYGYVALDGLLRGIPVISSINFGLNEFLKKPIFIDFNKEYFKDINDIIGVTYTVEKSFNYLNEYFNEGLFSSLKNIYLDLRINKKEYIFTMQKNNVLHRKLKKFIRDPRQFFRDSKIFKKKKLEQLEVTEVKKENKDICCVLSGKKYSFGKYSESKNKSNIMLFVPSSEKEYGLKIIEECKKHTDFSPFQKIIFGIFDEKELLLNDLEIINKIDVSNKGELNKIDFIFILNSSSSFCSSLRSCAPHIKVYPINFESFSSVGDGSISFSEKGIFSREIVINKKEELSIAMRRIVQENIYKEVDLLLPVFGSFDYDSKYLEFNTEKVKGLVILKEFPNKHVSTFQEISEELAILTDKVMLCDSIYLKYKDLIESISSQKDLARLYNALSQDSVKIHFGKDF